MTAPRAADRAPDSRSHVGLSIGEYLIQRLQDYGIGHIFGIPGDYVLSLYGMLEKSPIDVVGCTREDCAGFAADAYARIQGMGAICVTYCVGGLSVCNSIAGAYAEKSPVVMITGSPGLRERVNNPLLHHKVRDFRTQIEVFEKLCVAATELSDPIVAFREIDRVLDAAARFKRPVYIDIPRDMVHVVPHIGHAYRSGETAFDQAAAEEAAREAADLLAAAERPLILAGIELHRFRLQEVMLELAESRKIPVAATVLAKSVVRENHPLYVGVYEGAVGNEATAKFVEESDCILMLGCFMTDINLGGDTARLDLPNSISVTSEELRIRRHHYHDVSLEAFLRALNAHSFDVAERKIPESLKRRREPFRLEPDRALGMSRMMSRINDSLDERTIVIADIGDSLFAATELQVPGRTEFISPAYYTSMGFAVPAALGACVARPDSRVLAICGDGAFQMTGMELSTVVRRGFSPIVIVVNNEGYGTERMLHPGDWKYNDINSWKYHLLPQVLGGGKGYEVFTEGDFDAALKKAWDDRSGLSLIHVHVAVDDASQPLRRMAERLGSHV